MFLWWPRECYLWSFLQCYVVCSVLLRLQFRHAFVWINSLCMYCTLSFSVLLFHNCLIVQYLNLLWYKWWLAQISLFPSFVHYAAISWLYLLFLFRSCFPAGHPFFMVLMVGCFVWFFRFLFRWKCCPRWHWNSLWGRLCSCWSYLLFLLLKCRQGRCISICFLLFLLLVLILLVLPLDRPWILECTPSNQCR